MKLSSLKPGMVIYRADKTKMGNTSIRTVRILAYIVDEVLADGVRCTLQGGRSWFVAERRLSQYRLTRPKTRTTFTGAVVLVRRGS